MGPQLHETRMGQTFYQGTMPRIARALERIANTLELLEGREKEEKPQYPDWIREAKARVKAGEIEDCGVG